MAGWGQIMGAPSPLHSLFGAGKTRLGQLQGKFGQGGNERDEYFGKVI